ncbi:uncharacterized protein METZ01_LOCUS598 [marine metagenome]|uniref:Uncharacterized protein n=1 Tax=marine metagenome TaxID=408172 RepID=A0A381N125_9ZZZZ
MSVGDSYPPASKFKHRVVIGHISERDHLVSTYMPFFTQPSKTEGLVNPWGHQLNKWKSGVHDVCPPFN